MKLYGSLTSPYVRRLRILMSDMEHDFQNVNIFAQTDRDEFRKINPVMKLPMLEDQTNTECPYLYDSGVIAEYLLAKQEKPALSIAEKNVLSVINAASDSLVSILMLKRSDVDTNQDKLFFNAQRDRVKLCVETLNEQVKQGKFKQWNYPAISLLVFVEWATFRSLFDFVDYPELLKFVADNQHQEHVKSTFPFD